MKFNFKNRIISFWNKYTSLVGAKAVSTLEWEVAEMEHIFAITTMGTFIGFPAPPMQVTFELMPDMEKDLALLIKKIDVSQAPLSDLFSVLDIT
ncbi:MAG: hypothetical protein P8Y99_13120 [Calditrichaceae bacterium]